MHVGRPCYEDPSKNEREVLFVLAHRIKKFCSNIRPCYTATRPLMAGQPQCELFSQGLFLWHGSVKRQQGVGHRLLIVLKEQPHKLLWVFWVGLLSQRSSTFFFFGCALMSCSGHRCTDASDFSPNIACCVKPNQLSHGRSSLLKWAVPKSKEGTLSHVCSQKPFPLAFLWGVYPILLLQSWARIGQKVLLWHVPSWSSFVPTNKTAAHHPPPFAPLRLMFSKGNSSWSVVILTRWMWSSTRCKRAPASGQTVTSRAQSKLSWGAGSGAATLMCQIEIRHAFCFLLDYWNIWAQIILHTAARILCRLIIHWVALLFLQRIRADWVLWQNRMTRWLLCLGNQFENLSTFFFFRGN